MVAAYTAMVVHFVFVALVLLGGLVVWRWPGFGAVHGPVFAYAVIIEAVRFPCPLTLIEKDLRALAGLENYTRGFLGHYVEPYVVATGLPHAVYANMGYWTVGLNALLYVWLGWRCWTSPRSATGAAPAAHVEVPGAPTPPPASSRVSDTAP